MSVDVMSIDWPMLNSALEFQIHREQKKYGY